MVGSLGRWTRARRLVHAWLRDSRQFHGGRLPRTCPICGFRGVFINVGHPPRWDAAASVQARGAASAAPALWITEGRGDRLAGERITISRRRRRSCAHARQCRCETADLMQAGVTHKVDITDTEVAERTLRRGDGQPCAGAHQRRSRRDAGGYCRLLKPGGLALLSVPINATRRAIREPRDHAEPEQ